VAEGYVVGGIALLAGVYFLWKLERVGGLAEDESGGPPHRTPGDPAGDGHR